MTQTTTLVEKDGVIDYPLYAGQTLDGVWQVQTKADGPQVRAEDGYLHYGVQSMRGYNMWAQAHILTPLPTTQGCLLAFRVRANQIEGPEVKFTVAGNVILRFTDNGQTALWTWWDGTFHTLAQSTIKPDGTWHEVLMMITPNGVSLFEDGNLLFTYAENVGPTIQPVFDVQVLQTGASLSFDVGDIYASPPTFAPGVDTPWDYSFQEGVWPSPQAMGFRIADGGPQVSFREGVANFAAMPLKTRNTWSFLDVKASAPALSVLTYRLRVNIAGGSETKITLPGDNILRLTSNGTVSNWQSWDGNFHTLAPSGIVAGQQDFTIVTLVTTATKVTLLENGVVKYQRAYPTQPSWAPGLAVQHLDAGTNVSVDVGGIRTLPTIKAASLLAIDLQPEVLAYFPLKGGLDNIAGDTDALTPVSGTPAYADGAFGLAADFSGSGAVLQLPTLNVRTTPSLTVSGWVKVNGYPAAGTLTGIAGNLLLDSAGRLNVQFRCSRVGAYETKIYVSPTPLSTGAWHHVLMTYSYEEGRLGIYVDGKLDSLTYLAADSMSPSALTPSGTYVGGWQAAFDQPFVKLNGSVGDVMLFTQHVHQPTVNVLANVTPPQDPSTRGLAVVFLVPVFIAIVVYALASNIALLMYQQQPPQPDKPPTMEEVVQRIVAIVGQPAQPGVTVSRDDIGIGADYPIVLDIGGEGPLAVDRIITGVPNAINVNDKTEVSVTGTSSSNLPIPLLVQVQPWSTNPGYPFSEGFADQIVMMGAPLTSTNVDEMARVIRDGGEIHLWITDDFGSQMAQLAAKLNSRVEEVEDWPRFKQNGDYWFTHRRIVAHKG